MYSEMHAVIFEWRVGKSFCYYELCEAQALHQKAAHLQAFAQINLQNSHYL